MFPFITIFILGGLTAYVSFRLFDIKDKYDAKCHEAHSLKLNLACAESERNADFVSLNVAYDRIDKLEDKYAELCDRTGSTPEDSFVADLCDAMDDDACRCAGPCIQESESTYEYDDNGNLVGPDGFTYNVTDASVYSDDGNIACDRIKWTPDNVYTPDVDGDDDF
jgi:hypothetical protein